MAVYIITYDLKHRGKNYTDLLIYIRRHAWARLSESCYAIEINAPIAAVSQAIDNILDQNDNYYVIPFTTASIGRGPQSVIDWLHDRGL